MTKSLVKPRGEDIQEVQKFLSVAVNKKVEGFDHSVSNRDQ